MINARLDLFVCERFEFRIPVIFCQNSRLAVIGPEMFRCNQDAVLGRPMKHVLCDRTNHDGRPEHELVVNMIGLFIRGEIHRQTAHHRVTVIGHLPGK